ncbi:hypothetical protein VTH82DRAFT_2384 [Thermothelomyces myriococcoides]
MVCATGCSKCGRGNGRCPCSDCTCQYGRMPRRRDVGPDMNPALEDSQDVDRNTSDNEAEVNDSGIQAAPGGCCSGRAKDTDVQSDE